MKSEETEKTLKGVVSRRNHDKTLLPIQFEIVVKNFKNPKF